MDFSPAIRAPDRPFRGWNDPQGEVRTLATKRSIMSWHSCQWQERNSRSKAISIRRFAVTETNFHGLQVLAENSEGMS